MLNNLQAADSLFEGMRLRHLTYLDAVHRHGHFGDAADSLDVSQSALSQGISRLEQVVGTALIERNGRSHQFTPSGIATAAFARRVLGEAATLKHQLEARHLGLDGTLRLGLVDAAALYLLRDQIASLRADHPTIQLRLTVAASGSLMELLEESRIDVAIVVGPPSDDSAVEVAREPMFVYGPPIADLSAADRWVLYPRHSRTRRYIDLAFESLGIRPVISNESANPEVIAQLVRLGEGWTVLPQGIAETISDPLERRSGPITERALFAIRRPGTGTDALVDRLLAALV